MGIIYTEVSQESKEHILEKLRKNIARDFAVDAAAISLTCILFPQKFDDKTQHQIIEQLYPELLNKTPSSALGLAAKRCIDIIGSCIGLILAIPFFIVVPILIKKTSKGPVFFRQKRVGIGGKTFTFYKFRSMSTNNDPKIHIEFMKNMIRGPGQEPLPSSKMEEFAGKTQVFKMVNDPRVTPIGRFLRKTSIDELPQLINVLLGDMSLVGPRPAIPYEVREYDSWHLHRVFPVKPGITGVWQVMGRSHTSFDAMVRMDIQYINNWSPMLDLKLIFQTPFSILAAKGAY